MSAMVGSLRRSYALPVVLTPLLGRVRDVERIRALLKESPYRLVTLTGPGGVGKTRLALHVASAMQNAFEGQVVYVPIASIHDPALVLPAIGQAMGVFADTRNAYEDHLVDALTGKRLLLVLDNFEQVVSAAPALGRILGSCPDLRMLVTSQAALGIAGEQLYPLQPLETPASDEAAAGEILKAEAVTLFVQRAQAVNPGLSVDERSAKTIAEICRKLDGLPLAIELAAARTSVLSPEALLARLNNRLQVLGGSRQDVPDRLRTMRNAVAWSYELLQPIEQAFFRRLAVYAGGFSIEAAEAVFVPGDDSREAFDVLGTLVDRSMVKSLAHPSGEPRFLMLETLRDFGLEQLAALGEEDAVRQLHADFIGALADTAGLHLGGADQQAWLERLDPETKNFRAAIGWALAHGRPEMALRMVGASWRFWSLRGRISEARAWLDRALAEAPDALASDRAKALLALGHLAEDQRDLEAARSAFSGAYELGLATGDLVTASRGRHGLGLVEHDRGSYETAMGHHTEAVRLARESGDPRSLANGLGSMGAVAYFRGDLDGAERAWEESLELITSLGDVTTEALIAGNLGAVAMERGDIPRAERLQQRALDSQRRLNLVRDLPYTLINLGEIHRKLGDYTLAHDCLAEAIQLIRQQDTPALEGVAMHNFAELLLDQQDVAGAAAAALESTRLLAAGNDQLGVIETGEMMAGICIAHGNHAAAVELLGATDALRAQMGSEPHPATIEDVRIIESAAREALDAGTYEAQWVAGSALSHDDLVRRMSIVAREIMGRQQASPISVPSNDVAAPPEPEAATVAHNLTPREIEVLRLLAKGHSTREVAEMLFISPRTAGTHINNILGKLEVPSRTAAVAFAMRTGIV